MSRAERSLLTCMWAPEQWAFPSACQIVMLWQEEINRTWQHKTRDWQEVCFVWHRTWILDSTNFSVHLGPLPQTASWYLPPWLCHSQMLPWITQEWTGWVISDLAGNLPLNSKWYWSALYCPKGSTIFFSSGFPNFLVEVGTRMLLYHWIGLNPENTVHDDIDVDMAQS